MDGLQIRIYDYENLPFGVHVTVKTLNGKFERAISIVGNIAFEDGMIIPLEDIGSMEIYLGWQ